MPMQIRLANDVHLAWVGDDVVVLKVQDDAYACMLDAAAWLSPREGGGIELADPDLFDALSNAGILCREGANPSSPVGLPRVRSRLTGSRTGSLRLRLDFLVSAGRAAADYHRRSFAHMIGVARHRRQAATVARRRPGRCLPEAVGVFESDLPWVPFQGVCLHRTFIHLSYLHDVGQEADWVFGVRTWPFSAHCWLQVGDQVLADEPERVNVYTPILVI